MAPVLMRTAVLLTVLALPAPLLAAPLALDSGPARVSLIELFTSEGCSSCPPADRWLSERRSDGRLWTVLVPVAFHVDYWDYIGWQDRFASGAFSERQRRHAALGNIRSVYTPGFVVDGREWRDWFRGRPLAVPTHEIPGPLLALIDGERIRVEFAPAAPLEQPALVTVAHLGLGLETRVLAGENDGRTLRHDFVVLGMAQALLGSAAKTAAGPGTAKLTAELILPPASVSAPESAIAIWVSTRSTQRPLQAVGGMLPRTAD